MLEFSLKDWGVGEKALTVADAYTINSRWDHLAFLDPPKEVASWKGLHLETLSFFSETSLLKWVTMGECGALFLDLLVYKVPSYQASLG